MKKTVVAFTTFTVMVLAGCGASTTSEPGGESPSLQDAGSARADQQLQNVDTVEVGQSADIDGASTAPAQRSTVTVTGMKVDSDESGPWLETSVTVANSTSAASSVPEIFIFCSDNPNDSGGYLGRATVTLYEELPPMSEDKGFVQLLLPGNRRVTGTTSPSCATPAYVRASYGDPAEGDKAARWPVPDALVAEMNAKVAKVT